MHTNDVEGFWSNAKRKNKAMGGTTEILPSYLDEFQWRQLFGKKTSEAFDNLLNQISIYYPVNNRYSFDFPKFSLKIMI